jgi:hypothetical protein
VEAGRAMNPDIEVATAKPEPSTEKAEPSTEKAGCAAISAPVAIEPRPTRGATRDAATALDDVEQLARLLGRSSRRGWR